MNPKHALQRLIGLLKAYSQPTEEQTPTNGVFSHPGEVHAAIIGLGIGVVAGVLGVPLLAVGGVSTALGLGVQVAKKYTKLTGRFATHELRREPWYGTGCILFAYVATAYGPAVVASVL